MRTLAYRLLCLIVLLPLVVMALVVTDHGSTPPPGPPPDAERAIVALGDSTMSGEAAGDYDTATDGAGGDWCHRSNNAEIRHVALTGTTTSINLACSGATAEQVGLTDHKDNTETSQTRQLAAIAKKYRVVAIVVGVGANDDPHFSDLMQQCLQAFFHRDDPGCADAAERDWPARLTAMAPKVERALHDIRTTMNNTGYTDTAYQLVLQSYATPVGPDISPGLQDLSGCPFRTSDLTWVRDTAVPALSRQLHDTATRAGARFLDLAKAGLGHEACSSGNVTANEWFSRLSIDWAALQDDQRAAHALQQSFHPNARGHTQFARCLTEFLTTDEQAAACLSGNDGDLHPRPLN